LLGSPVLDRWATPVFPVQCGEPNPVEASHQVRYGVSRPTASGPGGVVQPSAIGYGEQGLRVGHPIRPFAACSAHALQLHPLVGR
jgi:hypothetical protein